MTAAHRPSLGRARLATIALLAVAATLAACTLNVAPDPDVNGTLALALRKTTTRGDAFRLVGASLHITGSTTDLTVTPSEDDDVYRSDLPAGDYQLQLNDGWQLERLRDGQWSAVMAALQSDNPQAFTITASTVTTLALRFAVADDPQVELAPGSLAVQLEVQAPATGGAGSAGTADVPMPMAGSISSDPCEPRLVINELDYDQEGSDTREFVELFNAGSCPVSTAGLALVLRNGGAANAPAYATIALEPLGSELAAGAYAVIGAAEVIASAPAGTLGLAPASFSVQNGPDAVELQADGAVLDAVAYAGVVAGSGEGAPAPADRGAGALGRCGNGSDSQDNAVDLPLLETPTPGLANACP
jgi:hypothetical protein